MRLGRSLLNETSEASEAEVRGYMRGTHCSCAGHASTARSMIDAGSKEAATN
jgi:aerobic-type carbon monoxide dehydrogenase small subunit (CoxS/CutS family)